MRYPVDCDKKWMDLLNGRFTRYEFKLATRLRHDLRFIDCRTVSKHVLKRYDIFSEVHGCVMQKATTFFLTYSTIESEL